MYKKRKEPLLRLDFDNLNKDHSDFDNNKDEL